MNDALQPVKDLRPDVRAPSAATRDAALDRLRAAIIAEGGAEIGRVRGTPRGRAPRWLPSAGIFATVAASLATVVIAVGAIVLLGHARHPAGQSAGSGHAATRGEILDRAGDVLAGNARTIEVVVARAELPRAADARAAILNRLGRILGTSTRPARCDTAHGYVELPPVRCEVEGIQSAERRTVVVATDVSAKVVRELMGGSAALPGVSTRTTTKRVYPHANLAAQAIGTIGGSGLEAQYDRELRSGETLRTSLDARLQRTGQQALQHAITANDGTGGAFVAMNPDTGGVYALGSLPTSGAQPLNRAVQGDGPIGSTFKPITALAALQSGAWRTDETFDDNGQYCVGGQCRHNSGHAVDGVLNLIDALKVGSDDFFYNLGARTNPADPNAHPGGGALDVWARSLGIGQPTGIDLPGTVQGTLPTPRWRADRNRLEQECDTATGPFKGNRRHPAGGCGIADGTNRPWSVGDSESLAVGQGDVQISPLQLAVAYAAIANGGAIVQPHLGTAIATPGTGALQPLNPPARRHLDIGSSNLSAVRQGLRDAASQPGGTSADVFGSFPRQVYGEPGAGQYINNGTESDDAWYAGYVPASATGKPIVVVVWVQRGGFGDVAAAPVARQLLSQWLLGRDGPWRPGSSTVL